MSSTKKAMAKKEPGAIKKHRVKEIQDYLDNIHSLLGEMQTYSNKCAELTFHLGKHLQQCVHLLNMELQVRHKQGDYHYE